MREAGWGGRARAGGRKGTFNRNRWGRGAFGLSLLLGNTVILGTVWKQMGDVISPSCLKLFDPGVPSVAVAAVLGGAICC